MQVPDFVNARIAGEAALEVIGDEQWFREEFTPTVANRGAARTPTVPNIFSLLSPFCKTALAFIDVSLPWELPHRDCMCAGGALTERYGRSSSASTAVSIADALKSLCTPTPEGDCFSSAVCTDGNPYGIAEGLIFSMPCRSQVGAPRLCSSCVHACVCCAA